MTSDEQQANSDLESLLRQSPQPTSASAEFQRALRERVLDEYDRKLITSLTATRWRRTVNHGTSVMSHPISRWAVAAAAAALVAIGIWTNGPRSSLAFANLVGPVVDATSATFKVATTNSAQATEITAKAYFLAPSRFRQEVSVPVSLVTTADFDRGKMLTLMPDKKEAMVFEIQGFSDKDNELRQNDFFGNLRARSMRTAKGKSDNSRNWAKKRSTAIAVSAFAWPKAA